MQGGSALTHGRASADLHEYEKTPTSDRGQGRKAKSKTHAGAEYYSRQSGDVYSTVYSTVQYTSMQHYQRNTVVPTDGARSNTNSAAVLAIAGVALVPISHEKRYCLPSGLPCSSHLHQRGCPSCILYLKLVGMEPWMKNK